MTQSQDACMHASSPFDDYVVCFHLRFHFISVVSYALQVNFTMVNPDTNKQKGAFLPCK